MRLLFLHQHFKSSSLTRGPRSYQTLRQLAAKGHEIHIIAATGNMRAASEENIEGVTVHWLPVAYSHLMSHRQRIKAFLSFAFRASYKARSLHSDVVFATSTPLTVAIPGIFATIFRESPLIFEVRDLWPDVPIAMGALKNKMVRKLAVLLEQITYQCSSHIVALSPDMKKGIMAKGVAEEKISVIPNASDNALFESVEHAGTQLREEHSWLGNRKLVLYCGTLGLVNDASYIARLAAATYEIDDSIRFLIVGEGNDEDRVRKTARELGILDRNFFMMKKVPKPEVPEYYAAADIALSTVGPIPELAANSANKVFDSFASGTPIAINHEGWLAQLIRECRAGLVLNSDVKESARELIEFLYSDERTEAASVNAKNLALTRFDREALATRLADLLESSLASIGMKQY